MAKNQLLKCLPGSLLALSLVVAASGQNASRPVVAEASGQYSNGLLEMSVGPVKESTDAPGGWRGGVLAITLKDVSLSQPVDVIEWDPEAQYECEVLDAAGKPVPLTAEGEKLRDSRHNRLLVRSKLQIVRLNPGEQFTTQLDIARLFQIRPKAMYVVKVRRSAGLPDRGQSGRRIEQELSRTWVIPGSEGR